MDTIKIANCRNTWNYSGLQVMQSKNQLHVTEAPADIIV
jgi:hypothetical protein